jgi:hypothetical protein
MYKFGSTLESYQRRGQTIRLLQQRALNLANLEDNFGNKLSAQVDMNSLPPAGWDLVSDAIYLKDVRVHPFLVSLCVSFVVWTLSCMAMALFVVRKQLDSRVTGLPPKS